MMPEALPSQPLPMGSPGSGVGGWGGRAAQAVSGRPVPHAQSLSWLFPARSPSLCQEGNKPPIAPPRHRSATQPLLPLRTRPRMHPLALVVTGRGREKKTFVGGDKSL